ncbi:MULTISPECIES: alpha/beta hydrolase [Actinoplanes]|uniref:alpha/beta fold hydrolase n=1 Tax=Actinoplanes TaxID=1865 RepID=UPI0005F2B533|nr:MULTISPECIES: alpha/beta hydrolase [Actinoplanes]GLY03449.1 hypothetical protein Acsp01_38280 [Actinoplanes sp. NBRC 101535]
MIDVVDVPGARIAYRVHGPVDGPGDGRPVVWLHGGSSDGTSWETVAAALPLRSYALDLRGYGASSRASAYGIKITQQDVIAVLDALGLDRVVLAGHSAGGVVAWRAALAHPGRFTALILEEPPPPVPHRLDPPPPTGPIPYDWAARQAVLDVVNNPDPSWWDDLSRITVPTLMIAGGPESFLDQDTLRRMAAEIPGSTFVTIGGGHRAHVNKPAEFTAAVADFLRPL